MIHYSKDPLFEALASLPPIARDEDREAGVRLRCHSAIPRRPTLPQRARKTASGAVLAAVCGARFLGAYLAVMLVEALRLAKDL